MCGIAAIVRVDGGKASGQDLTAMLSMIAYRGPDEAGFSVLDEGKIAFGQVRLSIVDISSGLQPMWDATGKVCIIFNGEIYDHAALRKELSDYPFRTHSDTEVILALYMRYGLDLFSRLNGEFAFMIWDERNHRLIAARDRHGIKPLFMQSDKNGFRFCSEAKGILTLPDVTRKLDPAYLTGALFGAWPANPCAFSGIESLRPGHCWVLEKGQAPKTFQYWKTKYAPAQMSFEDAKEGIRHHLRKAVKRRLVADVPVCIYLSGGVDSSLVAAMAVGLGQQLRAFTLGFTGSPYDETERARKTAGHLHLPIETVGCSARDLAINIPKTLFHTEACIGNAGPVGKMMLSSGVREAGYKVALTGEGADELFAGYPYFKMELIHKMMLGSFGERRTAARLWKKFKRVEARSEGMLWYSKSAWRTTPMRYGYPSFMHVRAVEISSDLQKLLDPGILRDGGTPEEKFYTNFPPEELRDMHQTNASLKMTLNWLSGYILINLADRMEMANSIEGRPAFLDHELASFAATIPPEHLIDLENLREKYPLYEAYASALPEEVRKNHKHPFVSQGWKKILDTPEGESLFDGCLSKESIQDAGIFSHTYLRKLQEAWELIPSNTVISKRLDTVMGLSMSAQMLHELFIKKRPRPERTITVRRIAKAPPRGKHVA